MNARLVNSIHRKLVVCGCMLGVSPTFSIADRAVDNWYKLYSRQRRVRRLRRVAALSVAFCKTYSSLKWGPAVAKDPLVYSTKDKLVAFAAGALKGVLRSRRFRNWFVESPLWFINWIVEFARDPVARGSKLVSAYYVASAVYSWAFSSGASSQ